MKKTILTLALFVATISIKAQTIEEIRAVSDSINAAISGPTETFDATVAVMKFEQEVIDYGKIKKGSDGHKVFKFTNTGGIPLEITNAKGSCGCTVATYSKEPILPGESGEIKVRYATDRVGRFSKTVTLTSNATEPKIVLRIKGEVLNPAIMQYTGPK